MWDDFDRPPACAIPIGDIKRTVAEVFGVEAHDLDSARRSLPLVQARHVAMGLAKRFTLRSLPEIGRQFGGRDHTTVLHAVGKYKTVIDRVGATMPTNASVRDWALALRHAIAPWQGEP
jgi:chromosomal replication initiation ATPase DnaA